MKTVSSILLGFTLTFLCISTANAFDMAALVEGLKSSGQKTLVGHDPETGGFILCCEKVPIQNGNVVQAQEIAKMQARVTIAETMKVNISSSVQATSSAIEKNDNGEESFSLEEIQKSFMSKDIQQLQRGVTVCDIVRENNELTVYCILIENTINATASLEKAMKKTGVDTVQVNGTGYFDKNISREQAEKNALLEAKREAIAQVLGISITSSSAQQTASRESLDNDENETFACDNTFKARIFSSAAGFVESYRIVDKRVASPTVIVTIIAKVAKDKLLNDYRAYLERMGNPGFCVRSNETAMIGVVEGFLGSLGLRTVDNVYDSAYILDVICNLEEENGYLRGTLRIQARDKIARTILFSVESNADDITVPGTSAQSRKTLCNRIFSSIKQNVHQNLNTYIGRANADGRKVQIWLCNYCSKYKQIANIIRKEITMVPGASNVRMEIEEEEEKVIYTLNYKNETEDLADFLEKQIEVDVKRRRERPVRGEIGNTYVEFNFE